MDLLIVQLSDVLQEVFNARKRSLPLQQCQHIHLNKGNIDTAGKQEIGHVLRRSLAGHRQNPQTLTFNSTNEIDGVTEIAAVKSAEDYGHQAGINLLSKRVTRLGSRPLLLLWLLRREWPATGALSYSARGRKLMYPPRVH